MGLHRHADLLGYLERGLAPDSSSRCLWTFDTLLLALHVAWTPLLQACPHWIPLPDVDSFRRSGRVKESLLPVPGSSDAGASLLFGTGVHEVRRRPPVSLGIHESRQNALLDALVLVETAICSAQESRCSFHQLLVR